MYLSASLFPPAPSAQKAARFFFPQVVLADAACFTPQTLPYFFFWVSVKTPESLASLPAERGIRPLMTGIWS
ncbi:hypothetical protein A7K73_05325 [Candidatus Methylacidiphilum fumarolicum]|nr:hypothetical protein A7K73_05325 [Candidatus Methylacidiphilum fumarolicum]TFE76727.1 hypothetical protein A7D33_08020 [Candidatus Methylacidiphilum fumarolicum]